MALDEYGDFGYRATVAAIYCSLLDLLEEGFLSPEEVRSMVIPTFGRSRQDFMAPFAESRSFAGLSLEED